MYLSSLLSRTVWYRSTLWYQSHCVFFSRFACSLLRRLVSFRHSRSWICCPPCARPTRLSHLFSYHHTLSCTTTNLAAASLATVGCEFLCTCDHRALFMN